MRNILVAGFLVLTSCQVKEKQAPIPHEEPADHQALSISGIPLYAVNRSPETHEKYLKAWDTAKAQYLNDSSDLENIIWYGRRTAYLQHYQQAVDVFSRGLKIHPNAPQLYRHRGHRYITLRKFDKAIQDFKKAAEMIDGQALEIEVDGLPNKLDIPLSNTQFNIYYHWGLAHYLKGEFSKAAQIYQECLKYCDNHDLVAATTDWMYMALRRDHQEAAADKLLQTIHQDMTIIENDSYFRRLLMYQGLYSADSLLKIKVDDDLDAQFLGLATQGYGVANWYFYHGDTVQALEILNKVIETDSWAAFGYIAAEADLFRWE